jgi:hypothetical protein
MDQHFAADDFMAPVVGRNVIATANGKTWKLLRNVSTLFALSPPHVLLLVCYNSHFKSNEMILLM